MVILPHQPLIMVDVNMPKEVYWLYPSKGFVLYCTEKSIEEPTNPVWQLATCTWNLYKNRNMSKALFDNVITPDGCLSMCLNCHDMEGLHLIWKKNHFDMWTLGEARP